jgi:hypothetical protein
MHVPRSRLAQGAIALTAAAGLLLTTAMPANAAGETRTPIIHVTMTTADSFTVPTYVHAGFVTFTTDSPDPDQHILQIFQVQPGHTLDDVLNDFVLGVQSADPADNARGARNLLSDSVLIGGATLDGLHSVTETVPMQPGTYYFVDLSDLFIPIPFRVHTMQAVGRFTGFGMPPFSAVIDTTMIGDQPTMVAPTHLDAGSNVLVVVTGDELHEAVFRPTRPGITDAYINTFYDAVVNGTPRPESPWTGAQLGAQAMSPGRYAVLRLDMPPGSYALICYVPSDESGLPHGYTGMHQVEDIS